MKKTTKIVEVVDDFDGSPADQTVRFAFNGASYEIDLSREHFEEFAEAIQPYIKAGRKTGSTRRRGNAGNPTQRLENAKIRAWALAEGHQVSDRGRIPAPIVEAYRKANRRTIRGPRIARPPDSVRQLFVTVLFVPVSLMTWGGFPLSYSMTLLEPVKLTC